ncbi:uncharacterized protein MONOS_12801 [Monocercomonoides exilis]|uniref:uncharacterized protein n=1 Tax=Monocercomonoides exilis TaxID=2049356 RepID=UPI003559A4A4|nr:hypothetical protein MONOS_12801 [Monocercomonoides exilis]|eukprot:MONOS_12801.1-p1 / transcript=MONOS_12801.1 / gene=MONOS_12801 / organism=Monocercomonoides_exilis_PA203 / gene_product=unspecified product / transcript_product=unspecified product / location=Mono_scaffold00734:28200-31355(-) / protein_length=1052 / sequence_SO=supercontig / SO=protein_coding / is_pseudo=false
MAYKNKRGRTSMLSVFLIKWALNAVFVCVCLDSRLEQNGFGQSAIVNFSEDKLKSCWFSLNNSTIELRCMLMEVSSTGSVLHVDKESTSVLKNVPILVDSEKADSLFYSQGVVHLGNVSVSPAQKSSSLQCSMFRSDSYGIFSISESLIRSAGILSSSFAFSGRSSFLDVSRCTFSNFSVNKKEDRTKKFRSSFCEVISMSGCYFDKVDDPVDGSVIPHFENTISYMARNNTFFECQRGLLNRKTNEPIIGKSFDTRHVPTVGITEVILEDCDWQKSEAYQVDGGAFYCLSSSVTLKMTNCYFNQCKTVYNIRGSGGAVAVRAAKSLFLFSCTFYQCVTEGGYGGGLISQEVTGCHVVSGCTFDGCRASYGGGLYITYSGECSSRVCNQYSSTAVSNLEKTNDGNEECENAVFECTFSECVAEVLGGGMEIERIKSISVTDLLFGECTSNRGGGLFFLLNTNLYGYVTSGVSYSFFDRCSASSKIAHDAYLIDKWNMIKALFWDCVSRSDTPLENRVYLVKEVGNNEDHTEWIPIVEYGPPSRVSSTGTDKENCNKFPNSCSSIGYLLSKTSESDIYIELQGSSPVLGIESLNGIDVGSKIVEIRGKFDTPRRNYLGIPQMAADKYYFNVGAGKLKLNTFYLQILYVESSMAALSGTGELTLLSIWINGDSAKKYTNPLILATGGTLKLENITVDYLTPASGTTYLLSLTNAATTILSCTIQTGIKGVLTESDVGDDDEFMCKYETGTIAISGGTATINNSTIKSNSWGGLKVDGAQVTLIDSTIADNTISYESMKGERNVVCGGGGAIELHATSAYYINEVQHWLNKGCTFSGNLTQITSSYLNPRISDIILKNTTTATKYEVSIYGHDFLSCAVKVEGKRESDSENDFVIADEISFNGMDRIYAVFNFPESSNTPSSNSFEGIDAEPFAEKKEKTFFGNLPEIMIRLKYVKAPNLTGSSIWDSAELVATNWTKSQTNNVTNGTGTEKPIDDEPFPLFPVIAISAGSVVVIVLIVICCCCCCHHKCCCQKKKQKEKKLKRKDRSKDIELN